MGTHISVDVEMYVYTCRCKRVCMYMNIYVYQLEIKPIRKKYDEQMFMYVCVWICKYMIFACHEMHACIYN